jgi:hypothetical protein
MSVSASRIALVTLGLVSIGAACGAVLGGITLDVQLQPLMVFPHQFAGLPLTMRLRLEATSLFFFFRFGAEIGACLGAALAPIVGWIFLRRTPLHRAIRQTALGTLLGIAVGAVARPELCALFAIAGFLAATAQLSVAAWQDSRLFRRSPQFVS